MLKLLIRQERFVIKRCFDLVGACSLILLLSPLMLGLAILIRISMGSPVLFAQIRPGRNASPFTVYKFRTMKDARDADGSPLPDKERLTALGVWLRRTSLDELPQLINVMRGEMSFVGPRPLLMEYLPLYNPRQARRHEVRPGITGWAQVNGRNAISWPEKFELDVWYVENQGLWLDLKILWLTLGRVLSRTGVNQPGQVTMERFCGNRE